MLWQALLWRSLLFRDRKTRSKILISLKSHTNLQNNRVQTQLFHTSHFKHFDLLNLNSVSARPYFLKISDFFSEQSHRPYVDFTMKAFSIFSRLSRTTTAELVVFLTHLLPHRQVFELPSQVGRALKKPVQNGTCHLTQKSHFNRAKQDLQVKKCIHTLQKWSKWKE